MARLYKPAGIHVALLAFVATSIVCCIGWLHSARERNHLADRLQALDTELAQARESLAVSQRDANEMKEANTKAIRELEERIASRAVIRNGPDKEAKDQTGPFAIPNGEIRWIDPASHRVWINLGEADHLKPRTTFSVYKTTRSRVNDGKIEIAIGPDDVKGALEVTRVLEAHLSEARIVHEDIRHPMSKGDPLYSATWHLRQGEAFSTIGIIDLDGDGAGDYDLFREIVATAGARIDNEVDENGVLRVDGEIPADGKPQITDQTKFVVIGRIPEVKETDDPLQVDRIQKILELRKELEKGARDHGVRVISLKDFLSYIGYKPKAAIAPREVLGPFQIDNRRERKSTVGRSGSTSKIFRK